MLSMPASHHRGTCRQPAYKDAISHLMRLAIAQEWRCAVSAGMGLPGPLAVRWDMLLQLHGGTALRAWHSLIYVPHASSSSAAGPPWLLPCAGLSALLLLYTCWVHAGYDSHCMCPSAIACKCYSTSIHTPHQCTSMAALYGH